MPFEEPSWWYGTEPDARARLLSPFARVYGWAASRRLERAPGHRSPLPVVCIGNFTAGGTGKTPLTLACLEVLAGRSRRAVVLSRGYGGRASGPRFVDAGVDRAGDVGDEPLLLARGGPVVIARDRVAGAKLIERCEPAFEVIVMDDGLQNPALAKDLVIAVVDARRGVGNACVIPAGPLRAPLERQLPRVDAIVINQPPGLAAEDLGRAGFLRGRFEGPVLVARPVPAADTDALCGRPMLAYSGIANPGRFFDQLQSLGVVIAARRVFADHHAFTETDARELLAQAARLEAGLVTTEKDQVRLVGEGGARGELRAASQTLPIRLAFAERDRLRLEALIDEALAARGGA